jgi:hypothetical protein
LKGTYLRWNIATPTGKLQIPSRICKEFFKFAKLIMKIPNELGTQKRNASRSLPVINNGGNLTRCYITANIHFSN